MVSTPDQAHPAETPATEPPLLTLPSTSTMLGTIELPGDLGAASSARSFVHGLLTGWADDRLQDALLLVTELASNACLHSDSGRDPNGTITLQVTNTDGFIHIQVTDQGSARSVPYLVPDPEQRGSGFGLRLVDQIASEWGHDYEYEGKRVVWFNLAPPPQDGQSAGGQSLTWTELMCQRAGDQLDLYLDAGLISLPPRMRPTPPAKQRKPHRSKQAAQREQITESLANRITSGGLTQGTPIPTVHILMDEHEISLRSASRIQRSLRDRGLVRLVPGHGYVAGRPGPPPQPLRPPVREQVVHVAAVLIRKIRRGDIAPHARVATFPELAREHGLSKHAAWDALCLVRSRGYAYDTKHKGTRATAFDQWPPEDTSLERRDPPPNHVPEPRRRKPRLTLIPKDPGVGSREWADNGEQGHRIEVSS
ncbi:ATP-binding protein [Acrocarpospora sp. B8E8]|uniref:ATP-binding protein n=1 Tax=Acrocarpospora sp. B8E8 TaxID=3153572 RepID=UPI00325F1608